MDELRLEILRRRLRERLAALGISPIEASRKAGLGLSYVNDILGGKARAPHPHRIATLAEVLGCTAAWLVGDDRLGDPEGDAALMRVARAIEAECRDLPHALKVARLALDASRSG